MNVPNQNPDQLLDEPRTLRWSHGHSFSEIHRRPATLFGMVAVALATHLRAEKDPEDPSGDEEVRSRPRSKRLLSVYGSAMKR